jgi:hypothetical protein
MERTSQQGRNFMSRSVVSVRRHPVVPVVLTLILILGAILALGIRNENEDVATNLTPIAPNVPAQDLNQVPVGLEKAKLTLKGGKFAESGLLLQQNQPTVLNIDNSDNQAYQLQFVPNLVGPTAIAAATTTQIEFTDPDRGIYEAQLLDPDTGQVMAKLTVEIETPAGDP